jgi:stage III sporulation protein AD
MELAEVFAVLGVGIVAAALAVVLRQHRPEFALLLSLAAGIFILLRLIGFLTPVVDELRGLLSSSALPGEYMTILVKALGICFLTQIAADACKDAGETAIAAKVELAGKISVLAVSLPLFREVMVVVGRLIG